jgi:hypothetical protein
MRYFLSILSFFVQVREKLDPGDPKHKGQSVDDRRKKQIVKNILILWESVIHNSQGNDPENIDCIDQQGPKKSEQDSFFQIPRKSDDKRQEQYDHADRIATFDNPRGVGVVNRDQNRQFMRALLNDGVVTQHIGDLVHMIGNGSCHRGTLKNISLLLRFAEVKGIDSKKNEIGRKEFC